MSSQAQLLVPYRTLASYKTALAKKRDLRTACGVAAVYRIATRPLEAADASMSYETARKVQQRQLKDRVLYSFIIVLGFVALYINIKRAANEHAAWENEHS